MRKASSVVFGLLLVTSVAACGKAADRAPAPTLVASKAAAADVQSTGSLGGADGRASSMNVRKTMLEVHAQFDVDLTRSSDAQATMDRMAQLTRDKGGFVGQTTLSPDSGVAQATLRIPAAEIPALRKVLADGGKITREQQSATDVTDAIADVDARLKVARAEEVRLLKLMEERSGSMGDVLAAEKALSDVRERIERLEASQRVAVQKVELATVDVSLRLPAAKSDEASLATRLGESGKIGLQTAEIAVVGVVHGLLRAGPTLAIFGGVIWGLVMLVRRAVRRRAVLP